VAQGALGVVVVQLQLGVGDTDGQRLALVLQVGQRLAQRTLRQRRALVPLWGVGKLLPV